MPAQRVVSRRSGPIYQTNPVEKESQVMNRLYAALLALTAICVVPASVSAQSVSIIQPQPVSAIPFAAGNSSQTCVNDSIVVPQSRTLELEQFTYSTINNYLQWQITVTTHGTTVTHFLVMSQSMTSSGVIPIRLYADPGTTITVQSNGSCQASYFQNSYSISGKLVTAVGAGN